MAADHVEGGLYISPEFQLGQVYDGTDHDQDIILYRPIYPCVPPTPESHNHNDITAHDDITFSNHDDEVVSEGAHDSYLETRPLAEPEKCTSV